ncbi:MAG TPA: type II toxin-antitoxin system VapC family toxin [Chthonomonadaceae bacterium]|nr:type II toxin-antitoxin system VapC family toxin [Chthonomonadaceae bacterium]
MLIDTHIWIWWVSGDAQLKPEFRAVITAAQQTGIEVSIISCWEVAKLVENKKLTLTLPILDWLHTALVYPGVRLLPLTPEIIVDSTQLPGTFHKDPADQMIVATARVLDLPLMTMDEKIIAYPHVSLVTV